MNSFIKAFDNLHWIVKLILALPALDIIWAVYRIIKGATTHNILTLIFGILWIIPGATFAWLIDMVCICIWKKPVLFA